MASPWEAALGESVESLHPRLVAYFGEIPADRVGRGAGVFDVVGTPRRWLWPVLAVLARDGVIFPAWQRDVPFTVTNRAVDGTVRAERVFHFTKGDCVMTDEVGFVDGVLSDRLGRHGRVRADLAATVDGGALSLHSTRTVLWGIPIPRVIAPRLTLTERWDAAADRQRVTLVLEAPVVGRLYEYSGSFSYEIVES